jgi:hypothetical protein
MFSDGAIAGSQLHVADLALAEVLKDTVRPIAVGVAMLKSLLARDDDYKRMPGRRYDPALLLAAKPCMYVAPSIVDAAELKSPAH